MSSCFLTQKFSPEYLRSNQMMSTCRVNQAFPCSFCHGENYFSLYHSEIYCIKQIFCKVIFMNFLLMFICFFLFYPKGEEVYDLLQYRFTSKKEHESNIEDIFDGQLYLKHFAKDGSFRATSAEQKQKEIHLSLQINTDGVALFNSSKFSIWPVYCVINELPPKCRCTTTCTSGKP